VNRDVSVLALRHFARLLPEEANATLAAKTERLRREAENEVSNRMRNKGETAEEAAAHVAERNRKKAAWVAFVDDVPNFFFLIYIFLSYIFAFESIYGSGISNLCFILSLPFFFYIYPPL
jgi:hypothetical protein